MRFDLKGYLKEELENIYGQNQLGFDAKTNGRLETIIKLVYHLGYEPAVNVTFLDGQTRSRQKANKNLERFIRQQQKELIAERNEHNKNVISLGTQLGKLKQELDELKKGANPS